MMKETNINEDKISCRETLNFIHHDSFLHENCCFASIFQRGRGNNWTVCCRKSCREIVCFLSIDSFLLLINSIE